MGDILMNVIASILGMHGVLIQLLTTEDQGQSHCNTELNNIVRLI